MVAALEMPKMKFSLLSIGRGEGMRMEDEDALGDIDGDDEEDLW